VGFCQAFFTQWVNFWKIEKKVVINKYEGYAFSISIILRRLVIPG
jgi:hypothetical protein